MRTRRRWSAASVVVAALGLAAGPVLAQGYPNRPVRIVVPFAAGGAVDTLARLIGAKLAESFGQPVVVENRAGAGGNVGADAVAKSAPDGYTILINTNGQAIAPALYRKLAFDPAHDFVPVTQIVASALVLVASTRSQLASVQALIGRAKANPGGLNYGSTGVGNPLHLTMEMVKNAAGIDIQAVPYRGDAPLNAALIAGDVDVAVVPMATARPHIEGGRVRALAVTGAQRSPALPDVPTLAEQGVPVEAASWQGFFAPANTPRDIVLTIARETQRALDASDVRERVKAFGAEPVGSMPEAFAAKFTADLAKFARIVEEARIPKQD
jgi:tripartite-type tricarboxylate transporter receptor subunit TctC